MSLKRNRDASKANAGDFETELASGGRQPFTKGWTQELNSVELLPIKGVNGKIIRKKVPRIAEEEPEEPDESPDAPADEIDSGMDYVSYDATDKETLPDLPKAGSAIHGMSMQQLRVRVATLCLAVTSAPEKALSRRDTLTDLGEPHPKLSDLLALLHSEDYQIKEVVMLSVALVFKDICPGYRIRPADKAESGVQLKKETKQLRDFEKALLLAYQQFLKFLDRSVSDGLGKLNQSKVQWNAVSKFGLSALRCQCELLRTMSHFNFRNILIDAVVNRASQPQKEISDLGCNAIRNEFTSDKSGAAEICYEIVKAISTLTLTMKHSPSEMFIDTLQSLQLRVHADEKKMLHRKEKQARRKRRKAGEAGEDVDAEMLEAHAVTDTQTVKRFQADTLQEVSLIYFRIIKKKIGFSLVPAALSGLSRITHLINMDMVEDLLALLKNLIESVPIPPFMIRLNALHCAFKTMSGPGEELDADDTVFLNALEKLLMDPEFLESFDRWDILLECVEVGIVKKRLEHHNLVNSTVQLLLLHAVYVENDTALTILGVVHATLLRYPRIRANLLALSRVAACHDEDAVQDVAMQGLLALDAGNSSGRKVMEADLSDASWVLNLLAKSLDSRIRSVVASLTSINIVPIPYKISYARSDADRVVGRIEAAFSTVKPKAKITSKFVGGFNHNAPSHNQKASSDYGVTDQPMKRNRKFNKQKKKKN